MTVIAYKDGVIAADSQETFGNRKIESEGKVFRVPTGPNKGHYICMSGESYVGQKLIEWYCDPTHKEKPVVASDPADDESLLEFLVVKPDRSLHLMNESGLLVPIKSPKFYAIGCGGDIAMGALHCGKSPQQAVVIACEYDAFCSKPVRVYHLPPLKPMKKKAAKTKR